MANLWKDPAKVKQVFAFFCGDGISIMSQDNFVMAVNFLTSEATLDNLRVDWKSTVEKDDATDFADLKKIENNARSSMEIWFRNQSKEHVKTVFDQFQRNGFILSVDLMSFLKSLNVDVCEDEIDVLFKSMDLNGDQKLDFQEIISQLSKPTELEQWTANIPFSQLIANCIPSKDPKNSLEEVSKLTSNEISTIGEILKDGIVRLIGDHIFLLKEAFHSMVLRENLDSTSSKFQLIPMSCGKILDFYRGLEGRIGSPHLEFYSAMESEHCIKEGCNRSFTTTNYKITTTPSFEWWLIKNRRGKTNYEWELLLKSESCDVVVAFGRRIPDVAELMKSQVAVDANLTIAEVVAVVLYTGPMFQVYNCVLRQWPSELFVDLEQSNNLFPTTIHVLVSAVQKISRVMNIPEGTLLYRGLGGTLDLPDWFLVPDRYGCRGFAEWAFMSTTSNKEIALKYSGVEQALPCASVLVIRVGAVARGACIRDLSQYPQEIEYLWMPCSFLEPAGMRYFEVTCHGVVTMIPVSVSSNLKSLTLEELLSKKKSMHLAAMQFALDETKMELYELSDRLNLCERMKSDISTTWGKHTPQSFVETILGECSSLVSRHKAFESSSFVRDEVYRGLVSELLELRLMAVSKLKIYIEDPSKLIHVFLQQFPLRCAHRFRISYWTRTLEIMLPEERRQQALMVCRMKGLLCTDVNELNELGESSLVKASADGASLADIGLILAAGVGLNRLTPTGCNAVMEAARFGHTKIVEFLIKERANVGGADNSGFTALVFAAEHGHAECLRLLLRAGAPVDHMTHGSTPLSFAAQSGHAECLRVLLEAKSDIRLGKSIYFAAESGHSDCVRLLANARANVNEGSGKITPVQIAEIRGHLQCVEVLWSLGAAKPSV